MINVRCVQIKYHISLNFRSVNSFLARHLKCARGMKARSIIIGIFFFWSNKRTKTNKRNKYLCIAIAVKLKRNSWKFECSCEKKHSQSASTQSENKITIGFLQTTSFRCRVLQVSKNTKPTNTLHCYFVKKKTEMTKVLFAICAVNSEQRTQTKACTNNLHTHARIAPSKHRTIHALTNFRVATHCTWMPK